MKLKHLFLLIFAVLICSNTYAGFLVKKQKDNTAATTTSSNVTATILTKKEQRKVERLENLNTLKNYVLTKADGKDGKGHAHGNSSGWEGIASIICGGLGILFLGIPPLTLISLPLGICAVVFGALGVKKPHRGLAIAGLILGAVTVLVWIIAAIIVAAFLGAL